MSQIFLAKSLIPELRNGKATIYALIAGIGHDAEMWNATRVARDARLRVSNFAVPMADRGFFFRHSFGNVLHDLLSKDELLRRKTPLASVHAVGDDALQVGSEVA